MVNNSIHGTILSEESQKSSQALLQKEKNLNLFGSILEGYTTK